MRYATNILAICVAGLLALGIVMLYSAGMAQSGARFLSMQLVWGGLGLIACFAATVMDYRALKKNRLSAVYRHAHLAGTRANPGDRAQAQWSPAMV